MPFTSRLGSIAPRARLALLWGFAALALASCSRQLPVAPAATGGPPRTTGSNQDGGADPFTGRVVVTVAYGTDASGLAGDYGATVIQREWDCVALLPGGGESAASLAQRMAGDARIVTAEQDGALETAESRQQSVAFDDGNGSYQTFIDQPAADSIGLDAAHVVSTGGGVIVAILDTGAQLDHPALAGRLVGGWDFIDQDATPSDDPDGIDNDGDGQVDEARGHGTHVAGIVARSAPGARLMIVRVLDADGQGDVLTVSAGIQWAVTHGARVINLSLGMLHPSAAIQNMLSVAENEYGVVCVASAGNWGAPSPQEFPATSSHVLAVAAVDDQRRGASFTSYGSFVALSAPGVLVRSAFWNGGYVLWSGTSMAAPFVSGTASMLLSLHPNWTRADVLQRLASSCRTALPGTGAQVGLLGAGALDAAAALAPDLHVLAQPVPEPPGLPWSPPTSQ